MKINRLILQNFRNHRQSNLTLDRLNFFVGHNNAGKSSILAAIEWGLTGKCLWTDRAGRGAADLVLKGAKQASVALDVEGIGSIVRTMPPHALQVGNISSINEGQGTILNRLATDEESLRIALNAGAFLSLSQPEQRAFLFTAYGLNFTTESVVQQLKTWFLEKGHQEDTALRLSGQAKGWYPVKMTGGPEVLDVMEKRAKEIRRDLKRDKQRNEAAIEEMELTLQSMGPVPRAEQVAEIRANLEVIRNQRDELLKQSGSKDLSARRDRLQAKLRALEEKISEVKAKASDIAGRLKELGEPAEDNMAEQIKILQSRLNAHRNQSATVNSRLKTLTDAAQALAANDRCCPLAPTVIQCGLTAKQVEKILAGINQEQNAAQEELNRISDWTRETASELAELEKRQHEQQATAKQYAVLQGEMKTQKILFDQFTKDKSTLEQELATLPDIDQEEANNISEQITLADQMIKTLETKLEQLREVTQHHKRMGELKEELKFLTDEVSDIEILVKALGPEGLRKKLLSGILDNFLERVNNRLARLTEGSYQIHLDEDMSILCRSNGGPLLPLKLLSKSELLRVGIAISESLSAKAGLNFLAIDEADMLDQSNRDLLTDLLLDLAEEYDQVLVFTTVGDVPPANPGIEGVKLFWVEDGSVAEVSQ